MCRCILFYKKFIDWEWMSAELVITVTNLVLWNINRLSSLWMPCNPNTAFFANIALRIIIFVAAYCLCCFDYQTVDEGFIRRHMANFVFFEETGSSHLRCYWRTVGWEGSVKNAWVSSSKGNVMWQVVPTGEKILDLVF